MSTVSSKVAGRTAGVLSIGAGVVHLVAAPGHADVDSLGWWLAGAGLVQIAWGLVAVFVTNPAWAGLGAVVNGVAAGAWLSSRTLGLPLPGEAGAVQDFGFQDLVAAVLGAGAALVAAGAAIGIQSIQDRLDVRAAVVVAGGLALLGAVAPHDHGGLDQSVPIVEAGVPSVRLPPEEATALLALSARATLGNHDAVGHDHGAGGHGSGFEEPPPPEELTGREAEAFAAQWEDARVASERLATLEAAAAAGYVQAATPVPGVGSHWIKWSLVDQPFDPAQPSMLLFDTITDGADPVLVGLSYWVASADEPEGFAGPNDSWHNHRGMCFINGWLRDEGVELREDCADTWIDGSDLWMLHAWTVDAVTNPWGLFADVNPVLCRNRPQVPDALSCNPVGI